MSGRTRGLSQPGQALLLSPTLSALTPMHGRCLIRLVIQAVWLPHSYTQCKATVRTTGGNALFIYAAPNRYTDLTVSATKVLDMLVINEYYKNIEALN